MKNAMRWESLLNALLGDFSNGAKLPLYMASLVVDLENITPI